MITVGERIRDRTAIKLDSWNAYVQAASEYLRADFDRTLDRLQAQKWRVRDALERMEREVHDAEMLPAPARGNLYNASANLREILRGPRPGGMAELMSQRSAIIASTELAELHMNTIGASLDGRSRLNAVLERAVLSMLTLECELEMAEIQLRADRAAGGGSAITGAQMLTEKLARLAALILTARSTGRVGAEAIEPEVVSLIGDVRKHLSAAQLGSGSAEPK